MNISTVIKNILPNDSRTIELLSIAGFMVMSSFIRIDDYYEIWDFTKYPQSYWFFLFMSLGTLHLYSLLLYPKILWLQTVLCYISGIFWLYVGLPGNMLSFGPHHILSVLLGLALFYAFLINFLTIKANKWKLL